MKLICLLKLENSVMNFYYTIFFLIPHEKKYLKLWTNDYRGLLRLEKENLKKDMSYLKYLLQSTYLCDLIVSLKNNNFFYLLRTF